jgi:hypothetical protein
MQRCSVSGFQSPDADKHGSSPAAEWFTWRGDNAGFSHMVSYSRAWTLAALLKTIVGLNGFAVEVSLAAPV